MGGAAPTGDFRYSYPIGEKIEGETQIYRSSALEQDEPLTTLDYETIDTLKRAFV